MRISFLHTIESNQAVFDAVALQEGLTATRHAVRADLRQAIVQQSTPSADIRRQIQDALGALAMDADAVIVSCAILGPAVDAIQDFPTPVIRADIALADAAARGGKDIVVLCAVESTIEANEALFGRYAAQTGSRVTVLLVPEAWDLFQRGQAQACLQACAQAAQDAYEHGADVVAFAHPWMAPAAQLVSGERRPMHGAEAAIRAAGKKN